MHTAEGLEDEFGHPPTLWSQLQERTQQERLRKFEDVADDFLSLIWCLDQYRIRGVPPRGMGKPDQADAARLLGAYRSKGNWFATLVGLLLENQTDSPLAPRGNVQGFSQLHQIDVAWPARSRRPIVDPLVCVETKVMGAPAYGSTKARGATSDWTNRRKELKFQATDLKLYRRQSQTKIDHWDHWRKKAPPLVYFLWCARMNGTSDKLPKMVNEVRALTETYLDGAGIFAYRAKESADGYEIVPLGQVDRAVQLDDVIQRIANEINSLELPGGGVPPPQIPAEETVAVARLAGDKRVPGE